MAFLSLWRQFDASGSRRLVTCALLAPAALLAGNLRTAAASAAGCTGEPPGRTSRSPQRHRQCERSLTPAGMILNAVRPERVADFEKVIGIPAGSARRLRPTPRCGRRRRVACVEGVGARTERAVLYVFLLDPAVTGAEYGLGRILAEAYPDQAKLQEIWKLYTDSLASGGSCSVSRQCNPRRRLSRSPKSQRSELQIHPDIESLHDILDRRALQREDAIVDARTNRPDQRDLHAAAGVEAEIGLAEITEALDKPRRRS